MKLADRLRSIERYALECAAEVRARPHQYEGESLRFESLAADARAARVVSEPLTIAVIVCRTCQQFIRVDEWRGADAHAGEPWCVSHGLCPGCWEEMEAACEAAERMAS